MEIYKTLIYNYISLPKDSYFEEYYNNIVIKNTVKHNKFGLDWVKLKLCHIYSLGPHWYYNIQKAIHFKQFNYVIYKPIKIISPNILFLGDKAYKPPNLLLLELLEVEVIQTNNKLSLYDFHSKLL